MANFIYTTDLTHTGTSSTTMGSVVTTTGSSNTSFTLPVDFTSPYVYKSPITYTYTGTPTPTVFTFDVDIELDNFSEWGVDNDLENENGVPFSLINEINSELND